MRRFALGKEEMKTGMAQKNSSSSLRGVRRRRTAKQSPSFEIASPPSGARSDMLVKIKKQIEEECGRIDILVNNAGATANGKIGTLSSSDWDKVVDVNLSAVFRVTRAFLPLLYRSEKGRILNVASRLGVRGGAGASNYAAAKAGLMAFTRSLAMEVGRKGILVNALNPGFMISGMTKHVPEEIKQRHIKESVLGTHADPEEIARFMMYILSDHCRGVSGQIFNYDSRIL